jgi:hypothetical protein
MSEANTQETIQKNIVPGHLRASTLPKKFPALYVVYESLVYRYLELFSSYDGGYWEFIELSNGGFYMSLRSSKPVQLYIASNGFDGEMSADAASIVVNLFAQCHLANQHELDSLIDLYHSLREYACEHSETRQILRAID